MKKKILFLFFNILSLIFIIPKISFTSHLFPSPPRGRLRCVRPAGAAIRCARRLRPFLCLHHEASAAPPPLRGLRPME